MKIAFWLTSVIALALADPYKPKTHISLPEAGKEVAQKIVRWMVHTAMDMDAWVLQTLFEKHCLSCAEYIGQLEDIIFWPEPCNDCVDPFWDRMRVMEGCEDCRNKHENCNQCEFTVATLFQKKLAIMDELTKPYFENMHFVLE